MPYAGELAVAPFYQFASATSSTATFTAETVTDTITVNLISGKTYLVTAHQMWNSSVANDVAMASLREDNVGGNILNQRSVLCANTSRWFGTVLPALYVAVATGSKTFVVTGQRVAGTGNITRGGASTTPSLVIVERKI